MYTTDISEGKGREGKIQSGPKFERRENERLRDRTSKRRQVHTGRYSKREKEEKGEKIVIHTTVV